MDIGPPVDDDHLMARVCQQNRSCLGRTEGYHAQGANIQGSQRRYEVFR